MTQILPQEPQRAAEEMLKRTEEVINLIEAESNAVTTNDGTTFSMNEPTKEAAIESYQAAAHEFHNRLSDFKNVDKDLIARLSAAQESLRQTTQNNLKILEKLESQE